MSRLQQQLQLGKLPTTVGSLAEVVLTKDQVRIQGLAAVHDPLDGGDERVLGPIVAPEVIRLNTPDLGELLVKTVKAAETEIY